MQGHEKFEDYTFGQTAGKVKPEGAGEVVLNPDGSVPFEGTFEGWEGNSPLNPGNGVPEAVAQENSGDAEPGALEKTTDPEEQLSLLLQKSITAQMEGNTEEVQKIEKMMDLLKKRNNIS